MRSRYKVYHLAKKLTIDEIVELRNIILSDGTIFLEKYKVGDRRDGTADFWKVKRSKPTLILQIPNKKRIEETLKLRHPSKYSKYNGVLRKTKITFNPWGVNHGDKFNCSPKKIDGRGIYFRDVLDMPGIPDEFKVFMLFNIEHFEKI